MTHSSRMTPHPQPPEIRTGYAFKGGKLYRFSRRHGILVVRASPTAAWHCSPKSGTGWQHVRPSELCLREMRAWLDRHDARLPASTDAHPSIRWGADRKAAAYLRFLGEIGPSIEGMVRRFHDKHYHLLALFTRCPAALELAQDHPLLAYCLATHWSMRKPVSKPLRASRSMAMRKRSTILDWLGFLPASESIVRITRKVPADSVALWLILKLRVLLCDPAARSLLAHLPTITADHVTLLSTPGRSTQLKGRFLLDLEELSREERHHQVMKLDHLDRMAEYLDRSVPESAYRSLAGLLRVHDRFVDLYSQRRGHSLETKAPLPPPPLPGSECNTITPLSSHLDLIEEGRDLRHCLGSLAREVFERRSYFYRLRHGSERGTIALRRDRKTWSLAEARGPRNAALSEEAMRFIDFWLNGGESPAIRDPEIQQTNSPG